MTLAVVLIRQISAASAYRACASRIRRRKVVSRARACWSSPGPSVRPYRAAAASPAPSSRMFSQYTPTASRRWT